MCDKKFREGRRAEPGALAANERWNLIAGFDYLVKVTGEETPTLPEGS
jgi:hypothetical protein